MRDRHLAAWRALVSVGVMGTAVGVTAAGEQPPGCNGNFVAAGISPLAAGQPIPPGLGVVPGQTITFRVTLGVAAQDPPFIFCDVAGGQLAVTLPSWMSVPSGQFVPVAGYPDTPPIEPFGSDAPFVQFVEATYVVNPAHAVNGHLHARVDYGMTDYILFTGQTQENGVFLSEPSQPTASASASHALPLLYPALSAGSFAEPSSICGPTPTEVTFTVTVGNPGETDLTGLVVSHDLCGALTQPDGDDGDGLLNPGESWTFTCAALVSGPTESAVAVTAQAVDFYGNPVDGPIYEASASTSITAGQGAACDIKGGLGAACAGQFCGPLGMDIYVWSASGGGLIQGPADQPCVVVQGDADGSFSVSLQVTDASGCGGACTINLSDQTPPDLGLPPDVTVGCGSSLEPAATGQPVVADQCDPDPAVSYQDATLPGSCAGEAVIMRTWTATDLAGNSSSGVQQISVVDSTPPFLVIPANIVIGCQASTDPAFTGIASATDACGTQVILTWVDQAGGQSACSDVLFRTWTATDVCGNSISLTQTITVADLAPPQLFLPPNLLISCDKDIDLTVVVPATANDPCSGLLSIEYLDQWASRLDPEKSFAPGQIPVECWQDVYIIRTWTATDACGNSNSGNQIIAFLDESPPFLDAPNNTTVSCEESLHPNNTGLAFAVDFCDPAPFKLYVDQVTPGLCTNQFTIARTWTAVDHCGNSSPPQVQIINVHDDIDPQLIAPPPVAVHSDAGLCGAILDQSTLGQPNIYDNCTADPDLIVTAVRADGLPLSAPFPVGATTMLWTVQDQCGNLSNAAPQTVNVSATSVIELSLQLLPAPVAAPLTRCVSFLATESSSGRTAAVQQNVTFVAGLAKSVSILVPCAVEGSPVLYDCLAARDRLHTLESTAALVVSGAAYACDLTGPAGLRLGDLDDDGFVGASDVLIYQQELGSNYGSGATPCAGPFDPLTNPHADLNGDGLVNSVDGNIIAAAMSQSDDPPCAGPAMAFGPPAQPAGFGSGHTDSNGDSAVDLLDALDFLATHPAFSLSAGTQSWFDESTWVDGPPDADRGAYIASTVAVDRPGALARARIVIVAAGGTLRITEGALEAIAVFVSAGGNLELTDPRLLRAGVVFEDGRTLAIQATERRID